VNILELKRNNFTLIGLKRRLKGECLFSGDLIIEIGRSFLGAPYQAGSLDAPGKEKLIVNFRQFDCTTFVETVLALARCANAGKISKPEFRKTLKLIRYRQGEIDGYASRLHYFTDWLRDNEKKKILKNISYQGNAGAQRKKINYMTTHRVCYPALKNESEFQKMLLVEKILSRKIFHIIGRDKVGAQKANIKNGDIIAFTTDQEGLDVAHVGFALWQRGNLYLLHASSKEDAVVISRKTISAYLKSSKKFTGIVVAWQPISVPLSCQR
jgi:cell wall-associated NlpC family hydrolase